ncbi:hypothetical protein WJX82_004132 [Trebouxia sp. C0006]
MISSRRKKAKKPVKPGPTHQKHAGRQPEWDPTISDLSGMKLNREEQAKRHAAFVSKNRVQLPETARAEAGHKAVSGSQPQEGFWNDVASLDFDAVAKSVHAMQSSCQPGHVAESDKAELHQEAGGNVSPGADAGTGSEESSRDVQGKTVQQRQSQSRVDGLQLGLNRRQEQVTSINAETGNGAVYTQSNEAGFGGRQNLSAGVHQKKADSEAHESEAHDSEAHEFDSVYADEAALPSFAQMAAAQGPQLAGGPQLWSDKQPRLQSRGRVNDCSLLSDRLSAAVIRPDFGLQSTEEPEPCPLPQRLTELPRALMHLQPGRQALTEIPMPQLRQRDLPHAPMPKQGTYNGPASLRLKPMSTGLPPTQPVVNVHDSLALSAWAGPCTPFAAIASGGSFLAEATSPVQL